jgi:phosphoribosylanthranilate isomerase
LEGIDPAIPYMLSGGLNVANIAEALAVARPSGIDISSGVESAPGVKDVRLIEAFFRAVAGARKNRAA